MYKHRNDITEQELESFKQGCELSFRLIYDRYHQILYRYSLSVAASEFDAEEAVQETFIQFFKNRDKIDTPAGIYPYLFSLTKRFLIIRFRQKVVKAKYNQHLEINWNGATNSTEDIIRERDLHSLLERYVNMLPPKQKQVYQLRREKGLSYDEISIILGISINTVKNHLIAASKKIKPIIEKHYLSCFCILFM